MPNCPLKKIETKKFDPASRLHECVSALEKKYPGLRRIKRANMDRSEILKLEPDQAVQVFLSHSSEQQDESERLKTMLLDLDASLQIYTSHSHRNDAKNIPLTRVFIPLLDDRYHRSKRCCKEFADAYAQGCSIIPLVLGQFEFPRIDRADPASKINFKEWWPRSLSGCYLALNSGFGGCQIVLIHVLGGCLIVLIRLKLGVSVC